MSSFDLELINRATNALRNTVLTTHADGQAFQVIKDHMTDFMRRKHQTTYEESRYRFKETHTLHMEYIQFKVGTFQVDICNIADGMMPSGLSSHCIRQHGEVIAGNRSHFFHQDYRKNIESCLHAKILDNESLHQNIREMLLPRATQEQVKQLWHLRELLNIPKEKDTYQRLAELKKEDADNLIFEYTKQAQAKYQSLRPIGVERE